MEATRGLLGEKDKITLEAHWDSHAHATDNNDSNQGKVKGDQNGIYLNLSHHSSSNPHSKGNPQFSYSI